jgi:hypothetical protein
MWQISLRLLARATLARKRAVWHFEGLEEGL